MARVWQMQEAKDNFGAVVEKALKQGPQVITRRDKETAVVLSWEDYRRMIVSRKKLSTFFRESPLVGVELDLARDPGPSRDDIVL
jgi:prevent-host-death family protein